MLFIKSVQAHFFFSVILYQIQRYEKMGLHTFYGQYRQQLPQTNLQSLGNL